MESLTRRASSREWAGHAGTREPVRRRWAGHAVTQETGRRNALLNLCEFYAERSHQSTGEQDWFGRQWGRRASFARKRANEELSPGQPATLVRRSPVNPALLPGRGAEGVRGGSQGRRGGMRASALHEHQYGGRPSFGRGQEGTIPPHSRQQQDSVAPMRTAKTADLPQPRGFPAPPGDGMQGGGLSHGHVPPPQGHGRPRPRTEASMAEAHSHADAHPSISEIHRLD